MIRFVESPQGREDFFAVCRGSAFGCKLAAVAGSYGFDRDFARFWVGDGLAFCLLDGVLSVAGQPENSRESGAFVRMLGPHTVFCPAALVREWGLTPTAGGPVLAKELPSSSGTTALPQAEPPKILDIWALLTETGMELDREMFYLDLSHRLRHGTALALGEYAEGQLVGCAVAFLSEEAALLSAVAVKEKFRRQGLGARLVRQAESMLPNRRLYLMREAGRNRAFYRQLGYSPVGRWRVATLGDSM